jgi:hypothetical protein
LTLSPQTAISFPIPLAAPLTKAHVHFIEFEATPPAGCSSSEKPEAEPGNLCVCASA